MNHHLLLYQQTADLKKKSMTSMIKFILSLFFSISSIEHLMHIIKNHILLYISMRRTPMKIRGWRGVLHCIYDFPLSYASAVEE